MIRILTLLEDILSSTSAQGRVPIRRNVPHDLGYLKSVRMHRREVRGEVRGKMEREDESERGGGNGGNGDSGDARRGAGKGRSRREEGKEDEKLLTSHFNREENLQHPVDTVKSKSVSAPLKKFSSKLDLEDCLLMPKQGGEDPVFRLNTVKTAITIVMKYHIISYHIISYHIISYHIISYHIISYHIIACLIVSELNTRCNIL